jgi:hypothetical protein
MASASTPRRVFRLAAPWGLALALLWSLGGGAFGSPALAAGTLAPNVQATLADGRTLRPGHRARARGGAQLLGQLVRSLSPRGARAQPRAPAPGLTRGQGRGALGRSGARLAGRPHPHLARRAVVRHELPHRPRLAGHGARVPHQLGAHHLRHQPRRARCRPRSWARSRTRSSSRPSRLPCAESRRAALWGAALRVTRRLRRGRARPRPRGWRRCPHPRRPRPHPLLRPPRPLRSPRPRRRSAGSRG